MTEDGGEPTIGLTPDIGVDWALPLLEDRVPNLSFKSCLTNLGVVSPEVLPFLASSEYKRFLGL